MAIGSDSGPLEFNLVSGPFDVLGAHGYDEMRMKTQNTDGIYFFR
jgi:hypothetical protein